jgi:hypothetical protein
MKKTYFTILLIAFTLLAKAQKFQLTIGYGYKQAELQSFNNYFVKKLGTAYGYQLKEFYSGSISQIDLRYSLKKYLQIGIQYSFLKTPKNPFQVYTVTNNSLNGQLGTKGNFYIDIRTSFYQVLLAYKLDSLIKNNRLQLSFGITSGLGYTRSIIKQYNAEGMFNTDLSGNEIANYERSITGGLFTDITYSLKKWQHYNLQVGVNFGYEFYQTQNPYFRVHFNKKFAVNEWEINLSGYHIAPILRLCF